MLDQIHKTESKTSIPKFTSRISMAECVGPPPQSIGTYSLDTGKVKESLLSTDPTERQAQITKMIDASPNGYVVIEDKTLPYININITYEEGKEETATALMSALTMFIGKLRPQL